MKKITICDKEYEINSNGYTRFLYKQTFDRKILADISKISEFYDGVEENTKKLQKENLSKEEIDKKTGNYMLENIDDIVDILLMLAYIFILTANSKMEGFQEWLTGIEAIDVNAPWVNEVADLAVSSFRGQGTTEGNTKNTSKGKSKGK